MSMHLPLLANAHAGCTTGPQSIEQLSVNLRLDCTCIDAISCSTMSAMICMIHGNFDAITQLQGLTSTQECIDF